MPKSPPPQFPKPCFTCCALYPRRGFEALRLMDHRIDDFGVKELRQCDCGAVLAVQIEVFGSDLPYVLPEQVFA